MAKKENNYIRLIHVKKALMVMESGDIHIDTNIINAANPVDMLRLLMSMQRKYEDGLPIEKIAEKIHELVNWKIFEFYPVLECEEKYLYQKAYWTKMRKNDPDYGRVLEYLDAMIEKF